MAVRYQIEKGVVILSLATEGFAYLRDALRAAAHDPAAYPKMPLLIDLRYEPVGARYDDIHWRVRILAEMREQFGPRWAFLTGTGPVTVGVGKMFAVFSEAEGLEVGMFADEDEALRWLTEARPEPQLRPAEVSVGGARVDVSLQHLQGFWQEVLGDPNISAGNRRHAEWKLENLRRADQGEPPLPVPEELRDPGSPDWSSHLYFIEHPYEDLE